MLAVAVLYTGIRLCTRGQIRKVSNHTVCWQILYVEKRLFSIMDRVAQFRKTDLFRNQEAGI